MKNLLKVFYSMKLFKNTSMASESIFLSHFSFFYRPVAPLCGSKKASRYKNLAFIDSSDILKQLQ